MNRAAHLWFQILYFAGELVSTAMLAVAKMVAGAPFVCPGNRPTQRPLTP
jgi:hypothetical protein